MPSTTATLISDPTVISFLPAEWISVDTTDVGTAGILSVTATATAVPDIIFIEGTTSHPYPGTTRTMPSQETSSVLHSVRQASTRPPATATVQAPGSEMDQRQPVVAPFSVGTINSTTVGILAGLFGFFAIASAVLMFLWCRERSWRMRAEGHVSSHGTKNMGLGGCSECSQSNASSSPCDFDIKQLEAEQTLRRPCTAKKKARPLVQPVVTQLKFPYEPSPQRIIVSRSIDGRSSSVRSASIAEKRNVAARPNVQVLKPKGHPIDHPTSSASASDPHSLSESARSAHRGSGESVLFHYSRQGKHGESTARGADPQGRIVSSPRLPSMSPNFERRPPLPRKNSTALPGLNPVMEASAETTGGSDEHLETSLKMRGHSRTEESSMPSQDDVLFILPATTYDPNEPKPPSPLPAPSPSEWMRSQPAFQDSFPPGHNVFDHIVTGHRRRNATPGSVLQESVQAEDEDGMGSPLQSPRGMYAAMASELNGSKRHWQKDYDL